MKRNTVLYIVLAIFALTLSGCAGGAGHTKYRGYENTPLAKVQPLQVDPNAMHSMSPQQFNEYMHRLQTYNSYVRDTAYSNAYYAYSEKQWVNDPSGGAPVPSNVLESGKAPKAKKVKPTAFQKEREKFIKTTTSTFTKEINKAWKEALKDAFR